MNKNKQLKIYNVIIGRNKDGHIYGSHINKDGVPHPDWHHYLNGEYNYDYLKVLNKSHGQDKKAL